MAVKGSNVTPPVHFPVLLAAVVEAELPPNLTVSTVASIRAFLNTTVAMICGTQFSFIGKGAHYDAIDSCR